MIRAKFSKVFWFILGLGLFLLPLLHAWLHYPLGFESPLTRYSALHGVLPWSDAGGYYAGANNLLENGTLDFWNTRRPLNAILFSIRFWLADYHFGMALLLQALLCGFSCLLVTTTIQKSFGKMAGLITLALLFCFAATFIPTTLSETLGLTLGCFAFVLLWEGMLRAHLLLFSLGTFVLTIGLNARAGAFFVLPLLLIWSGFAFAKEKATLKDKKSYCWQAMILVGSSIILGIGYNILLTKLYGDPTGAGATHSNFAPTLFGLVAGGKGWTYANTVFPDLAGSEAEVARFLYQKSFDLFLQNPFLLGLGVLKSLTHALKDLISFFQYKPPAHWALKMLLRTLGITLVLFCAFKLKTLYRTFPKQLGLLGIVFLGMILSASGLWTDGGFRVFAVTTPFFAAAVGVALGSFLCHASGPVKKSSETFLALLCCFGLLLTAVLGPKLIGTLPKKAIIAQFKCRETEIPVITRHILGAPKIALSPPGDHFRHNMQKSIIENKEPFYTILHPTLLKETVYLGLIYDIRSHEPKQILLPPLLFQKKDIKNAILCLCCQKVPNTENILQVQSFEVFNAR